MSSLFFDPHGDDVALFAAYTALAEEEPHMIVTHPTVPRQEVLWAATVLGCTIEFWDGSLDDHREWLQETYSPQVVYAPEWHLQGHDEHNLVSEFARAAFDGRVQHYLTYAPRGERSRDGLEVYPEDEHIWRKFRALSCFRSQIALTSTRPWFYELLDMREWTK